MKQEIEITARAIIVFKDKFLVCKHKKRNYYFFPGGHIDFGESIKEALRREIKEELGFSTKNYSFIGVVENFHTENFKKHHEIILAFEVRVDNSKIKSRENNLEFFLKNKKELAKEKVLPVALTKAVLEWMENKKSFWVSQINKDFFTKDSPAH